MLKRFVQVLIIPFFLLTCYSANIANAEEKEDRSWQDESMYFIMIDRFYNGDASNDFEANPKDPKAYHGGDLQGIIDKLDYIQEMGFTSIWLTPVFDNEEGGYHGYWIRDFKKVDENFGTLDDVKTLVKEAHKRDMKVVLDFVVNHTGYQHPWLQDPEKKDWFHEKKDIANWQNQEEVENGWLFGLPDLNTENPETRAFLMDAAKWWITETDIDGYRLDTVRHVPKDFWEEFSKEVKSVKEDFFLMGEVWDKDPRYVAGYTETGIDSVVDYPFYEDASAVFSDVGGSPGMLANVFKRNKVLYKDPYILGNFIDNHDNERFTRKAISNNQNPVTRLKMALTYMYAAPGMPVVYYGTEIALDGGKDPDNRRMMNFRANDELIKYVSKLGEIRSEFPSLRRGDMEVLYDEKGMTILKRTYEEEVTVIALNNTDKSRNAFLTAEVLDENKELRGLLTGDITKEKNGKYEIILDRETSELYEVGEKTGPNLPLISVFVVVPALFAGFLFMNRRKKQG
ncbi:alpha-amylase family glycosyl hydrolase [Metabacillus idriensis]|uniref:alpha-amylase family glycosyl hydrolase n=1 Tax=Metabacillus idriensis TaxID=324768 RepID=UPI00174D0ED6|nr:alpha-amylase family glycosyl hydrolase [Metabacillus idriensis]